MTDEKNTLETLDEIDQLIEKGDQIENLSEQVDELTKALDAGPKTKVPPSLQVDDQMATADKYLTPLAKEALNRKSTSMLKTNGPSVTHRCTFFGVVVAQERLEQGIELMAQIANELAKNGYLDSALAPIISIKLALIAGQIPTIAVVFYPLVPIEKFDEIEKHEFAMKEGDMPKKLGNTDLELPEGEFYAVVRLSYLYNKVTKDFDLTGSLFDEIQAHLAVLPKGTEFLGAKATAITDLSLPYVLTFSNPLLPNVKRVELEYVREAARVGEHRIEQFNLLTGISYYGAGNKRLYK